MRGRGGVMVTWILLSFSDVTVTFGGPDGAVFDKGKSTKGYVTLFEVRDEPQPKKFKSLI
jgi:hypothetical protein